MKFAKRLGVKLTAKDLSEVAPAEDSDATATDADAAEASEAFVD